jgi:hypothetical protein
VLIETWRSYFLTNFADVYKTSQRASTSTDATIRVGWYAPFEWPPASAAVAPIRIDRHATGCSSGGKVFPEKHHGG